MATIPQHKISPTAEALGDSDSIQKVIAKLNTSTASGLTLDEAARRLQPRRRGRREK